jgi:hypothetical protein
VLLLAQLFGIPFLAFFNKKETTTRQLYFQLWTRVKGYITKGMDDKFEITEEKGDFPFKLKVVTSTGMSCALCSSL